MTEPRRRGSKRRQSTRRARSKRRSKAKRGQPASRSSYRSSQSLPLGLLARRRPKKRGKKLALSRPNWSQMAGLGLLIGLAAALTYLFVDDSFYVQTASIDELSYTTRSQVYEAAGIHGYSVFWVNGQEVARRIEQLPAVKQASVQAILPDRVRIQVVEREPVAVWQIGGQDHWVDIEGVLMPITRPLENLPVLTDPKGSSLDTTTEQVDRQLIAGLLELSRQTPDVQRFSFDAIDGLQFSLPKGTLVTMGQPKDLANRVKQLTTLQASLASQGQIASEINFRYSGGLYYRLAQP